MKNPLRRQFAGAHTVLFRVAAGATALFIAATAALLITDAKVQPVLTGSMDPSIPQYSLVLATPVRAADLRIGDVVVFQPPAGYLDDAQASVMHRVVELRDEAGVPVMRTRGDANQTDDPWSIDLRSSALLQVQANLPYVGLFVQFLHNTTRHTGGMLTWPGLLILIGVGGYALRLRQRPEQAEPTRPTEVATPLPLLSEELRQPLSSIVGYTEILAEEELDPAQARVVETIARQAKRLAGIADDLSIWQSLEKPGDEEPADTCLLAILHQTRDLLTADLAAGGVDLEFDLEGDSGVRADPRRLRHALLTLLRQVVGAAQPGTIVEVTAHRDGDQMHISVSSPGSAPVDFDVEDHHSLAEVVAHRILEPHLTPAAASDADVVLSIKLPAAVIAVAR